jgi:sigma-B regulation protein RsbU (phosphoserine phosphatase)
VATVLVADDDPAIRALISRYLLSAGLKVLQAEGGRQALEMLEKEKPNLILLDRDMPDLSGFDVCQQFRQNPHLTDVPVIFLTGESKPAEKARGFELGGVDWICKPVARVELLARVRTHIAAAAARQALKSRATQLEQVTATQTARLDEVRTGQEGLLTRASTFRDLSVAVRFAPAHEAGGDFYELARLSEDCFGFLVADVSGHDLSVPYITGALKALSLTFMNEALGLEETMVLLNASLRRFLPDCQYVTACYGRFCRSQMEVEIVSAGHPPALYQPKGQPATAIEGAGDILGLLEVVRFRTNRFPVQSGDRLLLYSDGVTEGYVDPATGRGGRAAWGLKRLQSALGAVAGLSLTAAVDAIVDGVLRECSGVAHDDIVALAVEF